MHSYSRNKLYESQVEQESGSLIIKRYVVIVKENSIKQLHMTRYNPLKQLKDNFGRDPYLNIASKPCSVASNRIVLCLP